MIPQRKSSIRVLRKTISTDDEPAKIVTPATAPKSDKSPSSTNSVRTTKGLERSLMSFVAGKDLWKNVPLAIRCAKSKIEKRNGIYGDERVDDKLREMCDKAFVTGELDNRAYTLEEIGSYIGLTRERVRQVQEDALNNARALIKSRFGWEVDMADIFAPGTNSKDGDFEVVRGSMKGFR